MASIDLNSDLGEGWGGLSVADDTAMLELVTSANLACGGHGGDADARTQAVRAALAAGVVIGAHPSYVDREGFGRRPMDVPGPTLERQLREQVEALLDTCDEAGATIRYLKPHGALYSRIIDDPDQADAVARVAAAHSLPVMTLAGIADSAIRRACDRRFVDVIGEAFADRAYHADGTLVPRGIAGAIVHDVADVRARAVRMATDGEIETVDGGVVRVDAHSVCVHGDSPDAVMLAATVREALIEHGVEVRPALPSP
jgi:5-oxoprolinase (ATP-hydrolysing) subunit A